MIASPSNQRIDWICSFTPSSSTRPASTRSLPSWRNVTTELKLPVWPVGPTATRRTPPASSIAQRSRIVPSTWPEAAYVVARPSRSNA